MNNGGPSVSTSAPTTSSGSTDESKSPVYPRTIPHTVCLVLQHILTSPNPPKQPSAVSQSAAQARLRNVCIEWWWWWYRLVCTPSPCSDESKCSQSSWHQRFGRPTAATSTVQSNDTVSVHDVIARHSLFSEVLIQWCRLEVFRRHILILVWCNNSQERLDRLFRAHYPDIWWLKILRAESIVHRCLRWTWWVRKKDCTTDSSSLSKSTLRLSW